jgi:shikimate kinase
VAPLLGARLGVPWDDLDAVIERAAGRSVPEILRGEGEAAFRARERLALEAALAPGPAGFVLACGGGVVTHGPSREALHAASTVVWLRVGPAVAAARLGPLGAAERPLLAASGEALDPDAAAARLTALLEAREPLYRLASHVVVETDGRTPEQVAEAAGAALRGLWDRSAS